MDSEPFSSPAGSADRARYHARELLQLLGLVVLIYGTQSLVGKTELPISAKLGACLLAAGAFLTFFLVSERRRLARLDELGRKIAYEAYFVSFGVTVATTFFLGMLEIGQLLEVQTVHYPLLILLGYLLSLEWSRRRYL